MAASTLPSRMSLKAAQRATSPDEQAASTVKLGPEEYKVTFTLTPPKETTQVNNKMYGV